MLADLQHVLPDLTPGGVDDLLRVLCEVNVPAGMVVGRAGTRPSQFGIVLDGELARFDGSVRVGCFGRGDQFGVEEIKTDRAWRETVVAAARARVLVGHHRDLRGLADLDSSVAALFAIPVPASVPARQAVTTGRRGRVGLRLRPLHLG